MDFVDFVVIQGEPGNFAQSFEGSLGEDWDVVLAEVEMLQLPAVAERQGGYFWQPVEILYSIFKFVKKRQIILGSVYPMKYIWAWGRTKRILEDWDNLWPWRRDRRRLPLLELLTEPKTNKTCCWKEPGASTLHAAESLDSGSAGLQINRHECYDLEPD